MSSLEQWDHWKPYVDAAAHEGWTISQCDGSENNTSWQIQALDDAGILLNDDAAWLHVVTNARSGNRLAIRALEFIRAYSPNEYRFIATAYPEVASIPANPAL
jgi:hypothetical protein